MKIKSLDIIEFGGLKDLSLDFSEGLNIIFGKNESGKSTVLLFILYMLYGLPKSSKRSGASAYDKERSLSWDNRRAEGKMEISCDGRDMVIYRLNAPRVSKTEIYDKQSGKPINFSREIGEELLGLSRESFESCCWCGQLRTGSISGEHISKTLSNLTVSGDESIDAQKALSLLRAARREYKHERGSGGLIPQLEREIAEERAEFTRLGFDLDSANHERAQTAAWEAQLASAEDALTKASLARDMAGTLKILSEFDELDDLVARELSLAQELQMLDATTADYKTTPTEQDIESLRFLKKTHAQRKDDLDAIVNAEKYSARLDENAISLAKKIDERGGREEFISRLETMKNKMSQTKLFGIALSCAGALLAVTAAVFFGTLAIFVSLICACLGALAASAACFISSGKAKKAFDEYLSSLGLAETGYLSQIERAIAQYDIYLAERQRLTDLEAKKKLAQDALDFALGEIEQKLFSFSADKKEAPLEALDGLILELSEYFSKRKKLCGELSLANVFATRKREELATYDRGALQKSLPNEISRENIDVSRLDEDYKRCLAQRDNIKNQLYELSLSIERIKPKIERRRELDIDVDEKELLLEKYKREHAVLDLAYSALEEANSRQKSNFAPKIRARAGEILSSLSKGRYSGVILDDEFEVSVEQHGASRAAGALSAGTADAVYLSLRLALIDSIFASDAPLFLDESLSQLDSERASDAISLLSDFVSNGNQCLLFTCHHREASICTQQAIECNYVKLDS